MAPVRILIADDDQNIRKTLADILKTRGYSPITASNGEAALEALAQGTPAVALIDLKLEDMSGLELMEKIKTRSGGTECIVITGHATQDSAIEAINLGAYSFILKPYNLDHLLVTVNRAVEKRQALEALREGEEKYRSLFEFANDSIFIIDPSTDKILDVNENAARRLGYTREELLEMRSEDIVSPMDERYQDAILRVLTQTGSVIVEHAHQRKDGTTMPVEISGQMVDIGDRQVIQSVVRDISDRKEAEEALNRKASQQERLITVSRYLAESLELNEVLNRIGRGAREILDARSCDIYLLSEDGKTLTPVVVIEPMYPEEILSTPLEVDSSFTGRAVKTRQGVVFNQVGPDGLGPRIPGIHQEEDEKILVVPFVVEDEVRGAMCLTRLGAIFSPEDLSLAEAFAAFASVGLKNAQVHDQLQREVEERKLAERLLKIRNQFIETIMDNLPIGLLVNSVDDGTVYYLNAKLEEISGWPAEMMTDVDAFFDHVYPDSVYRQEIKERMASGLASGDSTWTQWENITMTGQTGEQKIVSATNIPLLEQNLLISTVQDITERVRMDGQLQWEASVNLVLAKVSKTLVDPTFSIEKMTGVIMDYAKMLTNSEHGFVSSIDPETGDLVGHTLTEMMGQCSIPIDQRIVFPVGPDGKYSKLWGHALNTKQAFYTHAPDTHAASVGVPEGHILLRSFLAAPALVGDQPVGLVAVSNSPDGYTNRELDAVKRLTDLYAAALVRKRAEGALIASEALYHDLVETSQDLIWRTDQGGRFTFLNRAWEGTHGYELDEMVGKPLTDFESKEVAERDLQEFQRLLAGGQVTGYETTNVSKSGDEIHLLFNAMPVYNADGQIIGTQGTAHDITRRKLDERKIQRQLERLEGLHKIDSAITTSTDLDVILDVVLEQITVQLEVDAVNIYLYEAPTQTLLSSVGRGFPSNALPEMALRIGEGYAGQVALERRMIHIPHLSAGEGGLKEPPVTWDENGFVSYFGVPLFSKGQVKGVLELYHRSALEPDREWLSFLDTLADQAAIAIDNTSLFDGLQRSNLELILAYDTTLEGWAKALELRDNETEGHSRRVTEMTLRLARAAGIREDELVHLRRGALLHDIGKMGVPDSILHNTGSLSEGEWEIMHRHPIHAYELLAPISFLRPALDIPYCHHEKWDGSGYPRGLWGEQIPMAARIFAVVDVWDALLSDRPYRDAWPEAKVLDYIREQVGKHFDPQVVEVFLRLVADESIPSATHGS